MRLPDWLSAKDWADFKQHRQRLRKPMTDRAQELMIAKLDDFRKEGHDPSLVIEQSIAQGWQGVFPLKGGFRRAAEIKRDGAKESCKGCREEASCLINGLCYPCWIQGRKEYSQTVRDKYTAEYQQAAGTFMEKTQGD